MTPTRQPDGEALAATRRERILELLQDRGAALIRDLAPRLKVSAMTVRRDLDLLAREGKLLRTHGGATAAPRISFEFAFLERLHAHEQAKRAIARRAAALVPDGSTVLLDSGTTTLAVARALKEKQGLTIITTSLPIASALQFSEHHQVLLLGGFIRRGSPDLEGALTEANLEGLRADVAFVGADGIDAQGGVYNDSIGLARMLGKMTAAAGRVYVVADRSKLGRRSLKRFGELRQWDGLIVETGAEAAFLATLRRAGAHIMPAT